VTKRLTNSYALTRPPRAGTNESTMTDSTTWRDEFPIAKDTVFFNHAAISPLPLRSARAGTAILDQRCLQASRDYGGWLKTVARARSLAAGLLATNPEHIAFTGNTSWGLSLVAAGLDWRPGDVVAVTWPDFPSVLFPWLNLRERGVIVREIGRHGGVLDMDRAAEAARGAKLVVASTVDWLTGAALDVAGLGRICRREGALLCLDAIQSLGVLSLDVRETGVDFLAAGCHKWLLGPMGLGIFYASPESAGRLKQVGVGWRSVENEETLTDHFRLKTDSSRFEPGTLDISAIATLAASLELLSEIGGETVRRNIFARLDELAGGLKSRGLMVASPLGCGERSSILAFEHADTAGLFTHFIRSDVAVSLRGGRIRLAPHFYNDASDVERFFAALDAYSG